MIGGIVLCGGRSRRMGQAKAWLPFGSETLLQRVVRILNEAARPIVVVAAPGQVLPELSDATIVIRDPVEGRGPLQGLATGLKALPPEIELAYATATDAPFLQAGWVTRLSALIGPADLAIVEIAGQPQPLAAVYRRRTALVESERLLDEGRSRLLDLLDRLRTIRIEPSAMVGVDPGLESLRNLNTPEEYEAAIDATEIDTQLMTER